MKSGIVCFLTMLVGFFYPILMLGLNMYDEAKIVRETFFALQFSIISIILIGLFGLLLDWYGNVGKIAGYIFGLLLSLVLYNLMFFS